MIPRVIKRLLFLVLSGCVPDLGLPATVNISCEANVDCPEDYLCNGNGRCVPASAGDLEAPVVVGAAVVAPPIGRAGTQFVVTLVTNEAVAELDVHTEDDSMRFTLMSSDGETHQLVYTATGDEGDGKKTLVARVSDALGNSAQVDLETALILDTEAPNLIEGSLSTELAAGPASALEAVSALAIGAELRFSFVASEPLAAASATLIDSASTPWAIGALVTSASFASGVYSPAGEPDGDYTAILLTFSDLAGNSRQALQPLPLRVDTVAPAVPSQALFIDAQWGRLSPVPPFAVQGKSEALALWRVFDALVGGAPLAEGAAGADGVRASLALSTPVDREVYVSVIDAAGNESPRVLVRDVEWSVTLSDAAGNPVLGYALPDLSAGQRASDAPMTASALPLTTRASGTWRDFSIVPPGRAGGAMVYDPVRARSLLIGGHGGAGCNNGTCIDLFALQNGGFVPLTAIDREGDGDPTLSTNARMAYDTRGQRILLWRARSLWESSSLQEPLSWRRIEPIVQGAFLPPDGAAIVYDEARDVLVFFGGFDPLQCGPQSACDLTWTYRRDNTLVREEPAVKPMPRAALGLVYDPTNARVLLFGGSRSVASPGQACGDGSNATTQSLCYYNDLWAWDGVTWDRLCDGVPAADVCTGTPDRVANHAVAFDVLRGQLFSFGGERRMSVAGTCPAGSTPDSPATLCRYSATWTFDTQTRVWSSASDPSSDEWPKARAESAAVYEASAGRVVVFGGTVGPVISYLDQTFVWDGSAYARLRVFPATLPPPRDNPAFAYAGDAHAVVMVGGRDDSDDCGGNGTTECLDAWAFDPQGLDSSIQGWVSSMRDGSGPGYSSGGAFVFAPSMGTNVYYGGRQAGGSCDVLDADCLGTWLMDVGDSGTSFTQKTVTFAPGARLGHTMFYSPVGPTGALMFGGTDEIGDTNDLWHLTNTTWENVCLTPPCSTNKPLPRHHQAAAFDAARNELVVFGGQTAPSNAVACGGDASVCGDTWTWNRTEWIRRDPVPDPEGDGNPSARTEASVFWDSARQTVVIAGGRANVNPSTGQCPGGARPDATTACTYADAWEWTGNSWARLALNDVEGDGGPGRMWGAPAAYVDRYQAAVLYTAKKTWFWESRASARPVQVLRVPLDASGWPAQAELVDLDVRWDASGAGALAAAPCTAAPGATLLLQTFGGWKPVAANVSSTPDALTWRLSSDTSEPKDRATFTRWHALGADTTLTYAVSSVQGSGCGANRATVTSAGVELVLRYRLP